MSTKVILIYKLALFIVLGLTLALHFYWFNGLSYYQNYLEKNKEFELISHNFNFIDSAYTDYSALSMEIEKAQEDRIDIVSALCKWEATLSYDSGIFKGLNYAGIGCCDIKSCKLEEDEAKVIRSVNIKLRLCDTYLLPLLYGLIGAMIFSLRNLANEVKTYTFNSFSRTNYTTRLFLGAFAGLAIGWFGDASAINFETETYSLAPILLAFAAGYNVEIFFLAIDRYIKNVRKTPTSGTNN